MCDLRTSFRGQMLSVISFDKHYLFRIVCIGNDEDEGFVRHIEVVDRLVCHNNIHWSTSRFQLQNRQFIEEGAKCNDKLLKDMIVECINNCIYSNNNMSRCKFPRSYPTIKNGISYNVIYSEIKK